MIFHYSLNSSNYCRLTCPLFERAYAKNLVGPTLVLFKNGLGQQNMASGGFYQILYYYMANLTIYRLFDTKKKCNHRGPSDKIWELLRSDDQNTEKVGIVYTNISITYQFSIELIFIGIIQISMDKKTKRPLRFHGFMAMRLNRIDHIRRSVVYMKQWHA